MLVALATAVRQSPRHCLFLRFTPPAPNGVAGCTGRVPARRLLNAIPVGAGAVATASATVIRTGRSHLASSLRCSASTAASSTPSSSAATTRTASAPLHVLLVAPAACPSAPLSRNFFRVVPRVGDDSVRCFRLPLVALSMMYVCQSPFAGRSHSLVLRTWSQAE